MKWLITGGAGFIGCNTAKRLLEMGYEVVIFDNLSRRGAEDNLEWLSHFGRCEIIRGDVRHYTEVAQAFRVHSDVAVVLHLAAQVAVTTSVTNPREDFEVNALGTFNVCEAVRNLAPGAVLLNASTNKVYGEMAAIKVVECMGHHEYSDLKSGVSEAQSLDFHSPYGCSKGTGDQYVHDYARIYGIKTVTFRQSCIYGQRQFGIEDQGWVAWFAIAAVMGRNITIYGDGKQVRDILFVDDLIDCYLKAVERIDRVCGQAYNVGGGPDNAVSVLEVLRKFEALLGGEIHYDYADWRPGDQLVFVCNVEKAKRDLGWLPKVSCDEGVRRLLDWVAANKALFKAPQSLSGAKTQ